MNTPHCPQCGRAVSQVDRAGGSCPWCGRVLTGVSGYAPKVPRRGSTISRSARGSSGGSSAWTYWWIPLVALMAMRGMMSCDRTTRDRPSFSPSTYRPEFNIPEVDRERLYDVQEMLERIERERREREAGGEEGAVPTVEFDENWEAVDNVLRRHREALERARVTEETGEAPVEDAAEEQSTSSDETTDPFDASPQPSEE